VIVGTAGHIDHGKTALVQALTGVNADRLPEEKRRGITIELGYAAMTQPDGTTIGFVDVPGHEKLVRTMVAGASGIDFALLLVAADDGVMPQTIEHLTILSLLGVQRGAALITKADRADATLLAQRETQVAALLAQAGVAHWPVLAVSAHRGDGMDALRALLAEQAAAQPQPATTAEGFRMGLDRVFTLDGIGTVVAGSIAAGTVRTGDMLCLAHAPDQTYRVRSLHSHNRSVDVAHAGQRCAVGLAGLERSQVERGQTLCDPAIALSTQRLDVWLQVAPTEEKPLRSGTRVHLHAGTQDTTATVAVLGQASIAPGQGALAQIVTQQPVHAWHDEGFVLRDASATCTVAGGAVLDAQGLARYRQTPERMAYLASQRAGDARERLSGALASAPFGIHAAQWLRQGGLNAWPFEPADLPDAVFGKGREWAIATDRLAGNEAAVLAMLGDFHTRLPEDIGPDIKRARRLALPRMPEALWTALVEQMAGAGRIARRSGFIHLPEHGVQLREAERIVAQRALPLLLEGRFDPPWVRDIAGTARLPEGQVRSVLARLARGGEVFQVVRDLYYHPQVVQQLADLARDIGQREGQVVAASFRDATGLGRKRAIQILEFFDRIGFLRRVGDTHLLRPGTPLFPPGSKP
jgi:selenocysteine-specific elongation factor